MGILAVLLVPLGILTPLLALLYPRLEFFGLFRAVPSPSHSCSLIPALTACEDQWLDHSTGLSYLACSSLEARKHWVPAMSSLNGAAVSKLQNDAFYMLNTADNAVTPINLENLPNDWQFHAHSLDIWKADDKFVVFAVNHRVPAAPEAAEKQGADSVVEIFETTSGSDTWTFIGTARHEEILTPNNLVATGPRSFYVSNDHAVKVGVWRHLEAVVNPPASAIVHCTYTSDSSTACSDTSVEFVYPNGITKGPGSTLYAASSLKGNVRQYEIQSDHSLVEIDEIILPRIIDNIAVTPTGEIIVAAIPKILEFQAREQKGQGKAAFEVWRISNETSEAKFYGGKYKTEVIFSNDGSLVSGVTNALVHKNKLYITGLTTEGVAVCEL